jgi:hypothetical protein
MKSLKSNYVFIDSQNLNLGVRSQEWILDFARFRVFLKDKYNIKERLEIKNRPGKGG